MKQTLQVTIEFEVEHTPDTPEHKHHVAMMYFKPKGVPLVDYVIKI